MKRLVDCLGKLTGKLVTREDADLIVREAQAYQAEGVNPFDAERRAVQDALDFSQRSGESLLEQIQTNAPQAHPPAVEFWNRETIRKAGEAPPPVPVTPTGVPAPTPASAAPPIAEAPAPAPPPIPEAAPPPVLAPVHQAVVDSLPENQRAKAARALEVDTSPDPHEPLAPAEKIAPEENKILGEASKYGLLDEDATAQSVMERIAADKSQPRWIRTIMGLLVQVGAGRNVEIKLVNRPDSNWPALYVNQGRNKPGQILINLAVVSKRGLAQAIAHEATHHVTMMKLRFDDYPLTDTERKAKEQLQKIFEDIRNRSEFRGEYAEKNLWEFASEVFSNDKLRAKLNAITPEGSRLTLMQIIRRLLAQVGFGDRTLLAGSLLDEAIRNTINVAGASAAEGIVTAPMAAEEHRMDIKREKREMAEKTRYTNAERTLLHDKTAKLLDKKGLTGAERVETERKYRAQIEDQVRAARAKFSVEGKGSDRWMAIEPKDVELQIEKGRKAQKAKKGKGGKPDTPAVEAIPDTEKAVVKWVEEAYTFEKGTDATEMARKVVDSVKEIAARAKDPNAEGHANAVIQMRQRGWYRNMAQRLRQEFGGFGDIFADLLGALSPNTGVDQNWKFAIIALRNVSRGVYDAELKTFDEWLKAGKSINDYKESGQPMILQPNGRLFGMNSDKAMKAILDYWRLIKSGDSPKARNFALNLIGQSNKATIDVWAARFLQRMAGHPRVPILAEKAVAGKHLTDVIKVGGAFGFGQEVFKQATEMLRNEMPQEFGQINPPDLQALVWFAEKELWGTKDWTSTIGEGGSFEAMADLEQVNRYLVGLSHERPHSVPTTQQQLAASKSLNAQLGEMGKVIASRVKDSYGMFMGTPERSFDIEVLTGPGFDPWEMVLHVASSAAANNQDSTFLSRVIPDGEINGNARPGLEIYFKEDVGPAALNSIMDFLKAKEVDGFTLVVDPRAEERVAKPVQMRGIRFQYIPEFSKDGDKWSEKAAEKKQILREAMDGILSQEGVASVQLVQYDTLVLTRNDYGNQINERELSRGNVGGSRARVWTERARDAQYSGTTEGGEGGGAVGAPTIPGGGTEPTGGEAAARAPPLEEAPITAPMAQPSYEDETTPLEDAHTGRAGLARAMAQRIADSGGNRVEPQPVSFGALSSLGRGAAAGGARAGSIWKTLGRSFRRREAALHGRIQEASRAISRGIQSVRPDLSEQQLGYETGQVLFDHLVNPDEPVDDIELAGYIDQIRDRVPVVPQTNFTSLPELETGAEARVFHDTEAGVVYKLFKVQDGKAGAYVPGEIRLGGDNQIRVAPGPRPSFQEFLSRIDRANSQGSIMPMEFVATTDAGDAVFAQPYFAGRGVSARNAEAALKRLDLGMLTQIGGTAALGKIDGKGVLFDDLHSRNLQTAPGGRVEVIDAINRELTPDEVDDLQELGKLPDVPDRPPITAPMAQEPPPVQYVLSGQSRTHGDVPVTVDIAKLDAAHAKEFPGDRVGPEGKGGIGTRYQQFAKWLSQGKPVEMSEMNFDHYGRPQFINGRHRFAVLRDQGQRTIDVAVPPDQVDKFRAAFAPEPQTTPALDRPGMAPQVGPVTQFDNAIVTAPMVQAYHGTPHEVEQFTTEKIGTGEGAQVYGWGLYFAQRLAVAEAYQKTTAAYTIDGMPVGEFRKQFPSSNLELARKENIPIDQATDRWQKIKPLIDAVGAVEDYADNAEFMLRSTEAKKALKELEASGRLKKSGNLYNVELDVNDDEVLDWDKPIFEQPPKVRQALTSVTGDVSQMEKDFLRTLPSEEARSLAREMIHGPESGRTDTDQATENWRTLRELAPRGVDLNMIHDIADYSPVPGNWPPLREMKGADVYQKLGNKEAASKRLQELGIPGIRYLDQGSRDRRPPYRGDSAFLHAAEGMKEYGYSQEQALKAMLEAYSSIPASDLHAAINEAYDIQPEQTYNYVIFDGKDIKIVAQNGKLAGTVADAEAAPVTAAMEERDKSYLDAVQRGDIDIAQRMVDEAAKAAGYTTGPVFHGTTQKKVLSIDPKRAVETEGVAFFSDNEDVSHAFRYPREYGEVLTSYVDEETGEEVEIEPGALESIYLSLKNPLRLEGAYAQEVTDDTALQGRVIAQAKKDGYDGIILKDVKEGVGDWVERGTTYGIFAANQAKSTSPITYDPAGNVMPVSQRFNPKSVFTAAMEVEPEGGAVAPMQATETPVQDDTDVISSPMHPQGYLTRYWFGGGVPGSGYQAGGLFTARGRFNTEIWEALRTKTQNGRAVELEADVVATQFRRAMKKTFGKKGPPPAQLRDINMALGTTDNRLTDAQAKQAAQFRDEKLKAQFIAAAHLQNVQAFKADQQAALARLPDDLRDLIVHMRDLIDTASKNLVKDAGLSTDLKAAITENMGVYLHRSYKIFEHNDEWINFLESQRPEAQKIIARARVLFETYAKAQKAKDHALEMKEAGTPVTLAQARAYAASQDVTQDVDALLEDYKRKGEEDSNVNLMAGRLPGKRGEAIMKERGQIPPEIRELWGEWDDPGINFMKSYVAAVTYLENTKFQNAVLTHGLNSGYMWKKGVSTGARPAKWVEIAPIAGSAKSMGALADVYGPKELADAFQLYNSPRVQGMIEKVLSATIALPLAAKTVGSIGSTVRNFFGNPAFALANGNVFNGSLWNAAKTSAAKFAKMGSDERIAYLRELVSLGIVGEDVTQGLLNDFINAVQKESLGIDPNENVLTKSWNATAKAMGKTIKGAAGLYSGVDNFWKVYGYEAELSKLKRAYRNDPAAPSEAEMKKQAADIVRKTMPTYSEAPAIMRETKTLGRFIAPFIMFKTEVMRVTYGTLHQAGIEMANPNWRIKRIGIQRFVGAAVMAALPLLLASATKFIFGYDDDDEDTIRDALPQWQKNATLMFMPKDKDGNPRYLDLSYMNPFNVLHAPITAAARALKSGDPDGPAMSAAAAGFFEFMRPFTSEQLGVAAMVDVIRNQDSRVSFRPLYNPQDSGTQKVKAVAERFYHTFSPGTLDSVERVYNASVGNVPRSGMPYDLKNEIMSPILGTKISTYDRMRGLAGQTARFEADKRDAGQLFTDPFNNRGTISEGAVADGYRKANEARKALYYTMRRNYKGAKSLGLTEKQAKNWMVIGTGSEFNEKGLTQADVNAVVNGKYHRYEASKESINEQRKLHPERVKEYEAARDAAPKVESIL